MIGNLLFNMGNIIIVPSSIVHFMGPLIKVWLQIDKCIKSGKCFVVDMFRQW